MKIKTLIPHYKRPNVLRITISQLPEWVDPVYVLSPQDVYLEQNKKIITESSKARDIFMVDNLPVSEKLNKGFQGMLVNYEFDYLMMLGSDDILNPNWLDHIESELGEISAPMIGLNEGYYTDLGFTDCYYYDCPTPYPIGAGRLVRRDVLEDVWPIKGNQNSGLDGLFARQAFEYGWDWKKVSGKTPMFCDIKSATNITTLDKIKGREVEQVDWQTIKPYFYG